MSIVNAFGTPEVGWVAVDTETSLINGRHHETSKLFALVHLNAVLAFRGAMAFVVGVLARTVTYACSFDDLAKKMPEFLREASNAAAAQAPWLSMTAEAAACAEVVMVGHSADLARIVVHCWRRPTLEAGFTIHADVGCFVAPEDGADAIGLNPANLKEFQVDREILKRLTFAQVRALRMSGNPHVAAGGRLIVAEIRQGGMTIETVCDLPAR
jgi:hypothetical protein